MDATSPAPLRLDATDPARPTPALLEAALAQLYRSHHGKLTGYFRRYGLDEATALDLAQDTFLKAWRGLAGFRGGALLSTWVYEIAYHTVISYLRSSKRGADRTALGDDGETLDPDTLSHGIGERQREVSDCLRRGFEAFARDHPERAHVIFLMAIEGWSMEQLADFLDRTPHAATEYLSQCRAKLKPYVAHCLDHD